MRPYEKANVDKAAVYVAQGGMPAGYVAVLNAMLDITNEQPDLLEINEHHLLAAYKGCSQAYDPMGHGVDLLLASQVAEAALGITWDENLDQYVFAAAS